MGKPTVGSLFSGIGGFDLGLERAGWEVLWQVEDNPFRQKILRRHWPHVELRTDIKTDTDGLPPVDLICGGFPCQDLSVAGRRQGLAGRRSSLWYEFQRVVSHMRPPWVFIENVPGLLSSHEGEDFSIVVSGLAECGYGVAWRVLDSQYYGVPQRRRRVFIVGYSGAACPPEVLFDPESCGGNTEAGEGEGTRVATPTRTRTEFHAVWGGTGRAKSHALTSHPSSRQDPNGESYVAIARKAYTLDGAAAAQAICQRTSGTVTGAERHNGNSTPIPENYIVQPLDNAFALRSGRGRFPDSNGTIGNLALESSKADAHRVRETTGVPGRMDTATPEEIDAEIAKLNTPDGKRYAALGDAVTVPVIHWIGERILKAHNELGPYKCLRCRRLISKESDVCARCFLETA